MITATYSPEDNKLRLYPSARLDAQTYERVKAAGFAWAPRQQLFVAPMWTPARADLCVELAGEIGDEDTSLVVRAQDRAERFDDYSDNRKRDAEAARQTVASIAEHIPFGQPILVGHHSERHARKDAERIRAGMRQAVQMWDTASYWTARAAGALAHAKYKERPDVRYRRIKGIEADQRKAEKRVADAQALARMFFKVTRFDYDTQTDAALYIAGRVSSVALAEGNACGETLYDALRAGRMHGDQAWREAQAFAERVERAASRWIAHYELRLAYERAMLGDKVEATVADLAVGGRVLYAGTWATILRINKKDGIAVSVSLNRKTWPRVLGVEDIRQYEPPAEGVAELVKAASRVPPLCNYAGDGFVAITRAEWDRIPKDYKGMKAIDAKDGTARHRVRHAIGCYVLKGETDWNKKHSYPLVFISDAKVKEAPKLDGRTGAEPPAVPAPEADNAALLAQARHLQQRNEARTARADEDAPFVALKAALRDGGAVQVVVARSLFPTPAELADRMVQLARMADGERVLEPSAGTGRLLEAVQRTGTSLVGATAVELRSDLCEGLRRRFACAGVDVICGDFAELARTPWGRWDVVLMNPPFERGQDIEHITAAVQLLKPGGRLVALCANGPRQQVALRPLVSRHGGSWEELPPDTFKAAGTSVRVALLSLTI